MLSYLAVRGLALLEDARLELEPGFNVLTGETGAGKSLIVDGLALVQGARAQRANVRDGTREIEVDAQFVVTESDARALSGLLAEHGLPPIEGGTLLLQRSVPKSGRSRCFVQGRLTTLPVLARVGAELVEITSQHEHQSLVSPTKQLALLDAFADVGALAESYSEAHRELVTATSEARELARRCGDRTLRRELVEHQLAELERLTPELGERERLAERVRLLGDAQRVSELARETRHLLVEDEHAALPLLAALQKRVARAGASSGRLARLAEALERVQGAAEEAAAVARSIEDELDAAPGALDAAEARLAEIERLCKRHATDADRLPEVERELARELALLETADEALEIARRREQAARVRAEEQARALHAARADAAPLLAQAVSRELAELCMPDARLEARVSVTDLGATGATRLELLFSANPGEPPAPLAAVASGGELSRLLLAVHGVVARRGGAHTVVFDEVDSGVGGRVAEAIGVRLGAAARRRQVLCITHLPQIAAFACAHFRVEKSACGGRTRTRVERLEGDDRTRELGRMLGGAEASARAHAEALLGQARRQLEAPPESPAARRRRGFSKGSAPRERIGARTQGRMLV